MACCAGHDSEDEDIAAQLGVGSLTADVELDALKDAAEGEILAMHNLVGRCAPLLVALCHNRCCFCLHFAAAFMAILSQPKSIAPISQSEIQRQCVGLKFPCLWPSAATGAAKIRLPLHPTTALLYYDLLTCNWSTPLG